MKNSEKNLLCEEIVKRVCEYYPDFTNTILTNEDINNEQKIKSLNQLLEKKNKKLINITIDTIEYIIELDRYIYNFGKAFALKTRRNELPIEKILDK